MGKAGGGVGGITGNLPSRATLGTLTTPSAVRMWRGWDPGPPPRWWKMSSCPGEPRSHLTLASQPSVSGLIPEGMETCPHLPGHTLIATAKPRKTKISATGERLNRCTNQTQPDQDPQEGPPTRQHGWSPSPPRGRKQARRSPHPISASVLGHS